MAQRFGGKYSPGGSDKMPGGSASQGGGYRGARPDSVGARSNVMFIPPVPLVFLSLNDGAVGLVAGLAAAGLLTLGAFLLREGLRAEAAFHERKVARRPAFPRKIAAACLTAAGVAIAAWKTDPGFVAPMLYAIAAGGLHLTAFGIDPLRDKGVEGIDSFQQDRVARAVDEAEQHLAEMREAILRARDRKLEARVERFQDIARDMFRTVEEDPRDLTAARKYLSVYLLGARDATVKFADIYARNRDPQARAEYEALLTDLQENFAARTEKMLLSDKTDLDVEIEVLRDRLRREGVRTE